MSILVADTCDEYTDSAGFSKYWDYNGGMAVESGQGMWGGNLTRVTGSIQKNFVGANTIIIQAGFKVAYFIGDTFIYLRNGSGPQLRINCGNDGSIRFRNHGSNSEIAATPAGLLSATQVRWYSIKIYVHASAGYIKVRDGKGTLLLDQTNINTKGDATDDLISAFYMQTLQGNATWYDDLIIMDTNGSYMNDWTKLMRLQWLLPSGTGNQSDLTRTGGSSSGNYTAVNQANPDDDTSYNSSPTPGARDLYTYPAIASPASTVVALIGKPVWKSSDGGAREGTISLRSGGTTYDHSETAALQGSYDNKKLFPFYVNPNGGAAFTVAQVNAIEVGPKVAA